MIRRLTSCYNPTQFVAVESQQCVQQSQGMLTFASHVLDTRISNCLSGAQRKFRLPDTSLPTRKRSRSFSAVLWPIGDGRVPFRLFSRKMRDSRLVALTMDTGSSPTIALCDKSARRKSGKCKSDAGSDPLISLDLRSNMPRLEKTLISEGILPCKWLFAALCNLRGMGESENTVTTNTETKNGTSPSTTYTSESTWLDCFHYIEFPRFPYSIDRHCRWTKSWIGHAMICLETQSTTVWLHIVLESLDSIPWHRVYLYLRSIPTLETVEKCNLRVLFRIEATAIDDTVPWDPNWDKCSALAWQQWLVHKTDQPRKTDRVTIIQTWFANRINFIRTVITSRHWFILVLLWGNCRR